MSQDSTVFRFLQTLNDDEKEVMDMMREEEETFMSGRTLTEGTNRGRRSCLMRGSRWTRDQTPLR
jgi:hypothetical protein